MKSKLFFRAIIVSFIFGFLPDKILAQGYIPFPMDSTTWKIFLNDQQLFQCWEQYLFDYTFSGDTILSGIQYRIVRTENQYLYSHINGSPMCSMWYNYFDEFYIRQDTANKKVYIRESFSNEMLLYDFNLAVGDTLFNSALSGGACSQPFDVVQSIDTVVVDSVYRRRWNFFCDTAPVIEGLGSVSGPFGFGPFEVACIHSRNKTYIGFGYGGNDSLNNVTLCSFPNPVSEAKSFAGIFLNYGNETKNLKIISTNDYLSNFQIKIFDLLGRVHFNQEKIKVNANNETNINLSFLPSGYFVAEVIDENLNLLMKKRFMIIN